MSFLIQGQILAFKEFFIHQQIQGRTHWPALSLRKNPCMNLQSNDFIVQEPETVVAKQTRREHSPLGLKVLLSVSLFVILDSMTMILFDDTLIQVFYLNCIVILHISYH